MFAALLSTTFLVSVALANTGGGVQQIPNGITTGRTDAKYGTYTTVVNEEARPLQDRLLELQNKAYGLSQLSDEDSVHQSEAGYALENEVVHLYIDIANAPSDSMNEFERESLLFNTVKAYGDVRHHSERLYENMIRYIDKKLPGPNGQQIRTDLPYSDANEALYYPNYRSDKDLTGPEKDKLYQEKMSEFLKKGGSLGEMKLLTPELFKTLPSYSRFEYVWLENGDVMVTEGGAGHILLAKGGAVKSAGQIVFVHGSSSGSTMMIVSSASGSYKPDLLSAQQLSSELVEKLGVSPDLAMVTKGEPMSTQAVKIYLKAEGKSPEAIKKELERVEKFSIQELLKQGPPPAGALTPQQQQPSRPKLSICASVFS